MYNEKGHPHSDLLLNYIFFFLFDGIIFNIY